MLLSVNIMLAYSYDAVNDIFGTAPFSGKRSAFMANAVILCKDERLLFKNDVYKGKTKYWKKV